MPSAWRSSTSTTITATAPRRSSTIARTSSSCRCTAIRARSTRSSWAGPTSAAHGAGEGFNVNYPLPWGTGFPAWSEALEDACRRVADYAPDVLLVSLGVDTFKGDPISKFRLESDDFTTYGARIARLGLPTLFVMEGGYAVEQIGVNAVNVLQGFEGA